MEVVPQCTVTLANRSANEAGMLTGRQQVWPNTVDPSIFAAIYVCWFEFKINCGPKFAVRSTDPEPVLGALTLNARKRYSYKATLIERKFTYLNLQLPSFRGRPLLPRVISKMLLSFNICRYNCFNFLSFWAACRPIHRMPLCSEFCCVHTNSITIDGRVVQCTHRVYGSLSAGGWY